MTAVHHLTKAQRRDLEKELRSECARLERSVMTRMATNAELPSQTSVLQRDSGEHRELAVALEPRITHRHQTLVSALRRFEAGDYGACLRCHNPIPYGRLLVMPEASYCVGCGS